MLVVVLVAIAASVAGAEQNLDQTPASVGLIAACGGVLAGLTLLARARFAANAPRIFVGVAVVLATFCGYGAGAQWWSNGLAETWPFLAWGLIVGPLPMITAGGLRVGLHWWQRRHTTSSAGDGKH